MKFLPTTTTTAAALFLASATVNMVDAGVCRSTSGVCSTDNNGEATVVNGVTFCLDDGCTIQLGENDITQICGVTISGIQACPETDSAVSSKDLLCVLLLFLPPCIMTRINQSINQTLASSTF